MYYGITLARSIEGEQICPRDVREYTFQPAMACLMQLGKKEKFLKAVAFLCSHFSIIYWFNKKKTQETLQKKTLIS